MTLCINFYGGPGIGKSSMAMGVTSILKFRGIKAEYIPEFMKEAAWEKRNHSLPGCQEYIFGKQHFKMVKVRDHVDVLVCDSPLLLGLVYSENYYLSSLHPLIKEAYDSYKNIDILLNRVKPYWDGGRFQTEQEAIQKDLEVENMLCDLLGEHNYSIFDGDEQNIFTIAGAVIEELKADGLV